MCPSFSRIVLQALSPMADCSVTDTLLKAAPFTNQSFLQMVDVTNLATIHSFLQNAPYRLVNQAVWWPVLRPDKVRRIQRYVILNKVNNRSRGRTSSVHDHFGTTTSVHIGVQLRYMLPPRTFPSNDGT